MKKRARVHSNLSEILCATRSKREIARARARACVVPSSKTLIFLLFARLTTVHKCRSFEGFLTAGSTIGYYRNIRSDSERDGGVNPGKAGLPKLFAMRGNVGPRIDFHSEYSFAEKKKNREIRRGVCSSFYSDARDAGTREQRTAMYRAYVRLSRGTENIRPSSPRARAKIRRNERRGRDKKNIYI